MQDDGLPWCTIESDPGVFTQLLLSVGVVGVEVQEIYSFEQTKLQASDVFGLVLLFKYDSGSRQRSRYLTPPASPGATIVADSSAKIYFAKQVITNACATQAILSVLLNLPEDASSGAETQDSTVDVG